MDTKRPLAAIALLVLSTAAQADQNTTFCSQGVAGSECATPRSVSSPAPLTLKEAARIAAEEAAADAKWLAFCKPTRRYDEYGLTRLAYAQPGCEFGRAE